MAYVCGKADWILINILPEILSLDKEFPIKSRCGFSTLEPRTFLHNLVHLFGKSSTLSKTYEITVTQTSKTFLTSENILMLTMMMVKIVMAVLMVLQLPYIVSLRYCSRCVLCAFVAGI